MKLKIQRYQKILILKILNLMIYQKVINKEFKIIKKIKKLITFYKIYLNKKNKMVLK